MRGAHESHRAPLHRRGGRLGGGDKFCLLLFGLAPHDAMVGTLARQLLDELAERIDLVGIGRAQIGLSIGVAAHPMHGSTAQDVMRAADGAIYPVKRTGNNSVAMASPVRGLAPRRAGTSPQWGCRSL